MKRQICLIVGLLLFCRIAFAGTGGSISSTEIATIDTVTSVTTVDTITTVDTVTDASITATVQPAGNSTLGSGYRDVATAGTAIAASSSVVIRSSIFKASLANTGDIYIGDSDVNITEGFPLDAGEVWIGTVDNLADIFINATVSGDSVGFTFETE